MKADHSQWRKIWKKVRSSKSCTCKTVALETSLEVSKLHVLSTQFSVLCYAVLARFYGVSTGLRHFCFCLFGKKHV